MPGTEGIESIGRIRQVKPGIKVQVFTMHLEGQGGAYICSCLEPNRRKYDLRVAHTSESLRSLLRKDRSLTDKRRLRT